VARAIKMSLESAAFALIAQHLNLLSHYSRLFQTVRIDCQHP